MIQPGTTRRRQEERRAIYQAFRTATALVPERARKLTELGVGDTRIFRGLCDRRVIREVSAGKFYLDEEARREFQWLVLRWLAVPAILTLAMLVYFIARG